MTAYLLAINEAPPQTFRAAHDRAARAEARRILRRAGYRIDSTYAPIAAGEIAGYNLGRHEGCGVASLIRARKDEDP